MSDASDLPIGSSSLDDIERFLVARLGSSVGGVIPIGQGEWSRAYSFSHDGGNFVVRFAAFEEDFAKDAIAATYASPELPIPRVVDRGKAPDDYFAISERAAGTHIDELDDPAMRAVLPSLFAALDAARQVDLSHTRGYGLWGADGNGYYESWADALLRSAGRDVAGERVPAGTRRSTPRLWASSRSKRRSRRFAT